MAMAASLDHDEETEALIGDEIETLRAIYMDDIDIYFHNDPPSRPRLVTYVVEPAMAHEKASRYVSFTLELKLRKDYPFSTPEIVVKNPRGLSEALVECIYTQLRAQAEDGKGNPVLYELMETAKDFITDQKLPTCGCAICLCDFEERDNEPDDFMRTDCFHFFHIECLTHYVEYSLTEIAADLEEKLKLNPHAEADTVGCPVCRIALNEALLESLPLCSKSHADDVPIAAKNKNGGKKKANHQTKPAPRRRLSSSGGWNSLPPDIRQKLEKERKQREVVFQRQKAKGAIIDLEEEKLKYKLTLDNDDGDDAELEEDDDHPRSRYFAGDGEAFVPSGPIRDHQKRGANRRNRRRRENNDHERTQKRFQDKVLFRQQMDPEAKSDGDLATGNGGEASSDGGVPTYFSNLTATKALSSDLSDTLSRDSSPQLPPVILDPPKNGIDSTDGIDHPPKPIGSREQSPRGGEGPRGRGYSLSHQHERPGNRGRGHRGGVGRGGGRGDWGGWRGGRGEGGGWRGGRGRGNRGRGRGGVVDS